MEFSLENPNERVAHLLKRYEDPTACAPFLLCDRHDPESVAYTLIAPDLTSTEASYGELGEESRRVAAGLWSMGCRPGDRVATLAAKSRELLVTALAVWRIGAVYVPLFTAFAPAAVSLRLNASNCKFVVCDAEQRAKLLPGDDMPAAPSWKTIVMGPADGSTVAYQELLEQSPIPIAPPLGGDTPLVQLYTSGTVGNPKGVLIPLRAFAAFQTYAEYGLGITPNDVFWNAADPGWAYGLYYGVITTFLTGVKSLLYRGPFSAENTFQIFERYGVTNFAAAPTVYRALRSSGIKPPKNLKIRCASSAGEPLTDEVNEWAVSALGVPVHDHYGQTETGMLINNHQHPALQAPLKKGSMGVSMPGWRAAVLKSDVDEPAAIGERGRVAMDLQHSPLAWFEGYVNDEVNSAARFSADRRWYITGDVACCDQEGYFHFSAREDDVIIMAGYRIGPFEVESVLLTHPAIKECAVIAVPDGIRGEVLESVVVLQEGYEPSEDLTVELQKWVKSKFAAHAYPRRVHYAANLPKTPSGKLQRFLLRQQHRVPKTADTES